MNAGFLVFDIAAIAIPVLPGTLGVRAALKSTKVAKWWNRSRLARGVGVAGGRLMLHAKHAKSAAGHYGRWHWQFVKKGKTVRRHVFRFWKKFLH